jgi:hypothetical protein
LSFSSIAKSRKLPSANRIAIIKRFNQLKFAAGQALKKAGQKLAEIEDTAETKEQHDEMIENLKQELIASPGHVFGHHDLCSDEKCQPLPEITDSIIVKLFNSAIDQLIKDFNKKVPVADH